MTEKEIQALKDERDALADKVKHLVKEKNIATEKQRAAELLLKKAIKVPVNYKGLVPFMVYDYDSNLKDELNGYLCMTDNEWKNHIAELQAEAGRAGYLACAEEYGTARLNGSEQGIKRNADQYAARVRQGGE